MGHMATTLTPVGFRQIEETLHQIRHEQQRGEKNEKLFD
jgi:hypothetical protein